MFKRVERKRKRREEEDELGLDQDMKETWSLVDSDSDESDSSSEHDPRPDADIGQDGDREEDEGSDEEPPISVAEALKDPIYLISLDPTIYGCVLCKGKLIKSTGMSTAHKNANLHKRHFEHFKRLAAQADPHDNAWELVDAINSIAGMHGEEPQGLSGRALKRQVKQAAIREKRERHKGLKAKAIAKKALKKPLNSRDSPVLQNQLRKPRKKRKVEGNISTATTMRTRNVLAKLASPAETLSGNKSKLKSKRKSVKTSVKL